MAAYLSGATSTRVVAVPVDGDKIGGPVTVDSWPVPASRICGPHPPDCQQDQTFIGDYIGLVATARAVVVAYIAPSAAPGETNRVLVSSLT